MRISQIGRQIAGQNENLLDDLHYGLIVSVNDWSFKKNIIEISDILSMDLTIRITHNAVICQH